jgi:hypothetical protein
MNCRLHAKTFLVLLAITFGVLALAGTAAADPVSTRVPTGWTWDAGAFLSPDGWTWDRSGALTSPDGWTWDDSGLVASPFGATFVNDTALVPLQTGWTWDGADIELPRGWTWDDSGAVVTPTGWTWDDGALIQPS